MKIEYIILPFGSSEYLIRCINSIYRQTVDRDKYYIILAENNFGDDKEKIENYLSEKNEVIGISNGIDTYEDKIGAAISSVPDDADYVMFIYVDTVLSPAAFSEFEKYDGSSVIIAGSAIKDKDKFIGRYHSADDLDILTSEIGFTDAVIGKELLKRADADKLCDNGYFHLFIADEVCAAEGKISVCDNICMYICTGSESASYIDYSDHAELLVKVFEKLIKSSGGQRRMKIYDSYMSAFLQCINSEDAPEDKKIKAFDIAVKLSNIAKKSDDILLNRLNELNIGCSAEEMAVMDYYSYIQFRQLCDRYSDNSIELAVNNAVNSCMADQKKHIEALNNEIKALRKEADSYKKSIDELCKENRSVRTQVEEIKKIDSGISSETGKLKNDIAALSKNMHFLSQSVADMNNKAAPVNVIDPIKEIPQMFALGKAGFSVILKSISAWFRYKFGGKSRN